ncbi:MAG TPA: hypothetical protein VLH10_20535, partial [Yinghuangia sp.]|nr:hypothetical protein [Yinghuangia sp.]
MTDAAAKAAAVERFLSEFPRAAGAGRDHPALRGCADVAWSEIPGCPPDVAELFFALLDPVAVSEAVRVLTHVLMDSPFHVGAAMPTALPFLLRLAVAADVTVVARLAELAWLAALACAPVGEGEPQPF